MPLSRFCSPKNTTQKKRSALVKGTVITQFFTIFISINIIIIILLKKNKINDDENNNNNDGKTSKMK
jgi:hypothetical protein